MKTEALMRFPSALLKVAALLALLMPRPVFAATLQCQQLPALMQAFGRNHYLVREVDGRVKARTVDKFIEAIDPSRTMLLEQDVAKMRKDLPSVFETMQSGGCGPLHDAYRLVIARAEEDERWVKKIVGPTYAVDEGVELILDPQKRGYPKNPEDRVEILKKMVHFQMSNYLVAGLDLAAAKKQLLHRYELISKRMKEKDQSALPTIFAEVFAGSLDPHSAFMSTESLEEFQIQMRLSLEGIGAALSSEDGVTVIESLVPGGQAERLNVLRPKDKIIAVAQDGEKPVPTIDMELKDVVKMIRGKKGTKVTLTILREEAVTKTFDVTIVRDKIDVKEQAAKITYETRKVGDRNIKIGILDLPSFYGGGDEGGRSSFADVKNLLEEAQREKVEGIVLDLSRNGGGLLEDAVKIAGLFMKKGGMVATKSTDGHVEVIADKDDDVVFAGPVVVLTSPASASASEILAGALQDYRRALIVGSEHTFGKGTVQVLLPLPGDLGAMKVTTGMFFLPGGESTQQKGVSSDIRVPSILDGIELGEKSLDYALPPQSTEAFISNNANVASGPKRWKPIDSTQIPVLARKSAERIAKDPRVTEIKRQLEEDAKHKGVVRLADLRKRAKENETDNGKGFEKGPEKGSEKGAQVQGKVREKDKEKDKFQEMQAAFVNEGVNIVLDLITSASPS